MGMTYLQNALLISLITVVSSMDTKNAIVKRQTIDQCLKLAENGTCLYCKSTYRGPKCTVKCTECITFNNNTYMCNGGSYGPTCESKCPVSCKEGINGIPICTESGNSFDCSNGCIEGMYGRQCNNTCIDNCKKCHKIDGHCVECKDYFFGDKCDKKCSNCAGGCFQNGTCKSGCRNGYKEAQCIAKCLTSCDECNGAEQPAACPRECQDDCPNGMCHLNGTCTYKCSADDASHRYCPKMENVEQSEGVPVTAIVLPLVFVFALAVLVAVTCICCKKKRRSKRKYNTQLARAKAYKDFPPDHDETETRETLFDDPEGQRTPRVKSLRRFQNYFWGITRSPTNQGYFQTCSIPKS